MLLFATSADAATITVPTTADGSGSACTLRDAIKAANFDDPEGACPAGSGSDLISITAVGTIALGSTLPQVESAMTISGPGDMALVALQGNGTSFRVLDIQTTSDVTISNLTVADGFANGDGGGISHTNGGQLTLDHVQLTGNEAHAAANDTFVSARGGGVFNGFGSSLHVRDSLISLNEVSAVHTGATGGAVADGSAIASFGPLTVERASVVSNTTNASSQNVVNATGAVVSAGQTQIADSGITGNSWNVTATGGAGNALLNGGGLEIRPVTTADTFTLENSTIGANTGTVSGTTAGLERGGGLDFSGQADGSVQSSTIAQNQANFGGANVHINASGHTLTFENSIVADNMGAGANCGTDNGTLSSLGHNLEEDATPAFNCHFTGPTDISGVDPALGSPADNFGPTPTMAISASSPVVDQGIAGGELTDQRGDARPRDLTAVANAAGGDGSDIGAYEFQTTEPDQAIVDFGSRLRGTASPAQTITVTNTTAGSLTTGAASLSGPDNSDFTLAADTCGVTLTSLATCTFNVTFAPQAATSVGAKSASVTVGDDVTVQPLLVTLSGVATVPAPPPPPATTPPSSAPPTAAAKKKCKKGRKLKKGKCVKRKKKK
jgi:CSLREA domain-containing protein